MQSYISFRETIKTLLQHRRLADMRNLSTNENKFAKTMVYISVALVVVYLMGLSIPFAMIANESRSTTSAELLCTILPFILALDFGFRFIVQQTPAQIVRPYMLLPLSRYACIDTFIFSSIFTLGNLTWLTFVLPYSLMSMVFSYGILTTLMTVGFVVVLVAANSQWYSIVRTLVNESYVWWGLPTIVYAALASPLYIGSKAGLDQFGKVYSLVGSSIDGHNPLVILLALLLLAVLVVINRKLQYKYVQIEMMRVEKKEVVKNARRFSFLERYGEIGTFLQLEIKLLTRNKNPRKAFCSAILTMIMLSAVVIFSDIYDSVAMTNFWALYNFVLLGSMILVRVMGYEGNYIDCMLVRRENILTLLRAKYIFYSMLLVLPFLLMLPVVLSGKWSFFMLVSYGVFTMGFQYCCLFQAAVYNKQTIPLNEKLTTKGGLDGNYIQMVIMAGLFIVPNAIVNILQSVFSENIAYTVMLVIGLVFIVTNKIWLRNIYRRMMKRKYATLESFVATR